MSVAFTGRDLEGIGGGSTGQVKGTAADGCGFPVQAVACEVEGCVLQAQLV